MISLEFIKLLYNVTVYIESIMLYIGLRHIIVAYRLQNYLHHEKESLLD